MLSANLSLGSLKLDGYTGEDSFEIREGSERPGKDIAIIGMAAKMPLARSVDEFWDNIRNGIDCIRDLPEDRREDADRFFQYKTGREEPTPYLQSAYVDDVDKFDYDFFRLTPQEANLMSPMHRMVLETAWAAVENAGYGGRKLHGSGTGVYIGFLGDLEGTKYKEIIEEVDPGSLPVSISGNLASMIPGRIAYVLNLKGPSVLIDTACSSSLVSIDHACRAIRTGSCDMAIAGGVRLSLLPVDKENYKIGIESQDCATRTFDDQATGSGLGEGIGIVVLKPLDQALRDRDSIHAVIKGSAVNQDGTSMGITAPNPVSQEQVLVKAWEEAGIDPESLDYIEVHGTATHLGDTLEIDGLRGAFRRYTDRNQFCAISSVKTNIGHLYESAGIAGLIKAVMALKHKQLPPSIHFQVPNKKISFDDSPVYINTMLRPWESESGQPRRCGVSSFGISGTNCHLVLEEAPASAATGESEEAGLVAPPILTLSARSEEALKELAGQYAALLDEAGVGLKDLCYTAGTGRHHHAYRLALVADDAEKLRARLAAYRAAGVAGWTELSGVSALTETEMFGAGPGDGSFGWHKLIHEAREERRSGEITEQERDALSRDAKGVLHEIVYAGNRDPKWLQRLCELYTQGADVEWETYFRGSRPRRLHLPVYPFTRNRCWVPIPEERPAVGAGESRDLFYSIAWKPEGLPVASAAGAAGAARQGGVLVFKDANGIGERLAERLRAAGRPVIEVELGAAYGREGEARFTLSGAEADYANLIDDLRDVEFDQILHLFSLRREAGTESLEELEAVQERGVYSLFHLTRALAAAGIEREIDIVLAADSVYEVTRAEAALHPEHATFFGMGKVVRREHENLRCRCIDLDGQTSVDSLYAEIAAETDVYRVAYRSDTRFVEEFTEADLARAEEQELPVKEGGTYLITGGTGGIGLETARYLAGRQRVNLVLLNRSAMPPRDQWEALVEAEEDVRLAQRLREMLEIEALGSKVACYSADVTARDDLQRVLGEIRAAFGGIDGIVHGAGVGSAEMIADRSLADFRGVFAPKVQGTWNLDELTREDNLDFLVLYSSIATMFSAAGQGDYTAANAYLDAFAAHRNKLGLRTLTINWSTWKDKGMAADRGFAADTIFKAITPQQAMEGFDAVFRRGLPCVLIGELNYEWERIGLIESYQFRLSARIRERLERRKRAQAGKKAKAATAGAPVKLVGRDQESYSEVERKIAQICQDTLGFAEINVYDSFFELGADSILLKKMHGQLDKEFPGRIAVADIFEHSTIMKLAAYIAEDGVTVRESKPEKEKKANVNLDKGVNDLLGEMESGNLSIEDVVESLSKL